MALHWNLSDIADHETVCWRGEGDDARLDPITETLIMISMAVGLGRITEKNWRDFAARLDLLQAIDGPLMRRVGDDGEVEPFCLDATHVRAHIGLSTNVSDETKAGWLRRMSKAWHRDAERRADRAIKEAAKEAEQAAA